MPGLPSLALPLAFASDSFSIAVMELVDNGVMLAVPGAMDATLRSPLFWGALAFALAVAFVFAYPLNRYLIARGRGHAVVHAYHGHGGHGAADVEPTTLGSRRTLLALGIAAVVVTVVVAAGGAMIVESRGEDEPAGRMRSPPAGSCRLRSPGDGEGRRRGRDRPALRPSARRFHAGTEHARAPPALRGPA